MKRFTFLIALLLLGLSVCSCGANTVEKACKKADKMLVEWTKEGFAGCSYTGEYKTVQGLPCYTVNARLSTSASSLGSDDFDLVASIATRKVEGTVYSELTDLFSEFEVTVLITVADSRGNVYAGIVDGEITWFD